ncbi:MAG: hypothetical protein AABX01_04240 [Candidatus Micrarchaeota archaeon]
MFGIDLLLTFQYALIGALLSEIDVIIDENKRASENAAILLSIICSLLMAWLIIADANSAILFGAILFGVFISGKVDALPFILGLLISAGALLQRAIASDYLSYLPIVLALAFCGVVDEYGNDRLGKIKSSLMNWFFRRRITMKLGVFSVAYLGVIPFSHLVAFLAFDIAYEVNSARAGNI